MILKHNTIYGRFISKPISAELLFADITEKAEKSLASLRQGKNIPKGKIITEIGRDPKNIYILLRGQAQMAYNNGFNLKSNIRSVEKNEIIGLTQLIASTPEEISVVTLTPCVFEVIPAKELLQFLYEEPQICFRLASLLSSNIQHGYLAFTSSDF